MCDPIAHFGPDDNLGIFPQNQAVIIGKDLTGSLVIGLTCSIEYYLTFILQENHLKKSPQAAERVLYTPPPVPSCLWVYAPPSFATCTARTAAGSSILRMSASRGTPTTATSAASTQSSWRWSWRVLAAGLLPFSMSIG